jgi:hypothetical protein
MLGIAVALSLEGGVIRVTAGLHICKMLLCASMNAHVTTIPQLTLGV